MLRHATRSSRCSARCRTTTCGSPGCAAQQSPSRANLQEIEPFALPTGKVLRKISPLAQWTTKEVWDYAREHDIPLLPLYDRGYTSIGCEPCTTLPIDPGNERSGRWARPEARVRHSHRRAEVR